jgi:hypothetical protein
MSDVLDGTPGFTLDGFTWAVGGPTQPFEPHQDLDGAHIENANDDQLAWDPGDFPYVSVLWPGDHTGCQCVLVPDGEALEAIPVDVPDE